MTRKQTRALNKALAAELRTLGMTPAGVTWQYAKAVAAERLTHGETPEDAVLVGAYMTHAVATYA